MKTKEAAEVIHKSPPSGCLAKQRLRLWLTKRFLLQEFKLLSPTARETIKCLSRFMPAASERAEAYQDLQFSGPYGGCLEVAGDSQRAHELWKLLGSPSLPDVYVEEAR